MNKVISGLELLNQENEEIKKIKGNVAYLCHSASIDSHYRLGVFHLKHIFGPRLKKIFGPQHGFVTDVQDNMVETTDYIHPYFKLPVYSLYSHTRIPTDDMLEDIDTIIIDLQDVGTRVYTYISTMTLLMEKCTEKDIAVVILDRPNPAGGEIIEGNLLEEKFVSFVGRHPIPMRHAMTMGEMALYANKFHHIGCNLTIIPMKNWSRSMFFKDTGLPWVLPSPNLPTMEGAVTFVGTVLFEGTNISEGRGTTRSLEIIGHPKIEPFSFCDKLEKKLRETDLDGLILRPIMFMPTFQKHAGTPCGGMQIQIVDYQTFRPWRLGQFLCRELYLELGKNFEWKQPPYEYEYIKLPIDLINGSDKIRNWVESNAGMDELIAIEQSGMEEFKEKRKEILIY